MTRLAYMGAAAAALITVFSAARVRPAVTVYSDNAQDCFRAAKYGDRRGTGLEDCDDALFGLARTNRDYAGTLHRGNLLPTGANRVGTSDYAIASFPRR